MIENLINCPLRNSLSDLWLGTGSTLLAAAGVSLDLHSPHLDIVKNFAIMRRKINFSLVSGTHCA